LNALYEQATALNQAIAKTRGDADLWPEVYGAAEALADQDRGLSDYDADQVIYGQTVVPVWPVERQVEKVERGVNWLIRVIGEAASRQEVVGHRPPDEPLNMFICGVEALYRDTAANPEIPRRDGRARKIRCELMQLLLACLTPPP
jgi:hypothetical protein